MTSSPLLAVAAVVATPPSRQVLGSPLWVSESFPTCWNRDFTADRCCQGEGRLSDPLCWASGRGLSYERCCNSDAQTLAAGVASRWSILVGASFSAVRPPIRDLVGCISVEGTSSVEGSFGLNGPERFLRHFNFGIKQGGVVRNRCTALSRQSTCNKRFRLRQGHLERPGRCSPAKIAGSGAPLSVTLLERLGGLGTRDDGLIVNLGAGCYRFSQGEDPMDALVLRWNLSAVLVDPMGPCAGAVVGASSAAQPRRSNVRFVRATADPENICRVLHQGGFRCLESAAPSSTVLFVSPERRTSDRPLPVVALKIDIDSCDCALAAAALRHLRPMMVWLEVNLAVPPPVRFARGCNADFFKAWFRWSRHGRTFATYGCSLSSAVELMESRGYGLYGFDGGDAVFVEHRFGERVGGVGIDEFLCYTEVHGPTLLAPAFVKEWSQVSPEVALARIKCNFSLHDYLLGISHMPFFLEA
eukprot:TRINITY_DN57395_c0_g1_i1.p1 TRINITY_DN57395_c0_g1~~TRINITY_DN57395_c0_g1_i1.p1  ORF type:complete len:472 (-),score=52.87 TRINITY_DN57395_c0_g1_i1:82-1497(-)